MLSFVFFFQAAHKEETVNKEASYKELLYTVQCIKTFLIHMKTYVTYPVVYRQLYGKKMLYKFRQYKTCSIETHSRTVGNRVNQTVNE